MKNDKLFSAFSAPITNTKPCKNISLMNAYNFIKGNAYKKETASVRSGSTKAERDALKSKILPYITVSGIFSERKNAALIKYSGYIIIDLDHCDITLKDTLSGDSFLNPALIFISPLGEGLKVCIAIEGAMFENHSKYFTALRQYFWENYQLKIDEACKDVSRACFLCHDPEAYFSDGWIDSEKLLSILPEIPEPPKKNEPPQQVPESVPEPPIPAPAKIPEIHKKPSEELNRLPSIHDRAVSALKNNGWQQEGEHWTRPGKDPKAGSSAKYNMDPKDGLFKFTNFSDNGHPFTNKGYTDVGIICLLEYRDDWTPCIKNLLAQYLPRETGQKTAVNFPKIDQAPGEYFETRTFMQVVEDGSKEPPRRKIVGAFLYEDTNSYFFSRTNYGKSLLAFQFGYAAATGKCFDPCFALRNECEPMKVLIVDLELESRDIYERHGKAIDNMDPELLKNLIYIHEKSNVKPVFNFELLDKIEKSAIDNKAKLIIIDNISKLLPDLLKAEDVSRVIEKLKRIRQNNKASFLVIGHTTKGDQRTAISPTSYYGSAMLQNFFTELFYLDMTKDEKFFLCHSKTKRAECYNKNVPVLNRSDESKTGYGFTYERLESISDVQLPLTIQTHGQRKTNLSKYRNELLIIEKTGIKRTVIADICNVDRSTITRILDG